MAKRPKPNLSQVAETAQVSTATVDRVLNNRGGVRPELERRVLDAARDLQLDRNLDRVAALSPLKFAVLMNRPEQDVYRRLQAAFRDQQRLQQDRQFQCYLSYFDSQAPEDIVARIHQIRPDCDGLIIVAYDHPMVLEALDKLPSETPIVALLSDLSQSQRIYYAGAGNREAGGFAGDLMGRLLQRPKGKALIITRLQRYTAHGEREMSFRQALSFYHPHLSACHVLECNHGDYRDHAKLMSFWGENGPFDGIYSVSSWNVGLLGHLRDLGLLGECICISHGSNKRTRDLLLDGSLDFAIEFAPEENARQALDSLLHHHGRCDEFDQNRRQRLEVFSRSHLPPST